MKKAAYFLTMVCAFALGAVTFGGNRNPVSASESMARAADPPAYLLAVGKRLKPPEALAAYRQAAGPLAMAAGYQQLATQAHQSHRPGAGGPVAL